MIVMKQNRSFSILEALKKKKRVPNNVKLK